MGDGRYNGGGIIAASEVEGRGCGSGLGDPNLIVIHGPLTAN